MKIRLRPDAPSAELLAQTIAAYTASFNVVTAYGWDNSVSNGIDLHKATYYEHRAQFGLPAQLTCAARVKATEALKSVRALAKKGKVVRCPKSQSCPVRYDQRSYSVWFDRLEVTLLTIDGRVKLPFSIPAYYAEYASWKPSSADLIRDRKNRWWLHIVMITEINELPATDDVVGIDLGIVCPAADSNGNFYGSEHWKVVSERIFEHRRRLQAKGTKSAKRRLQKLSGRQARFRKDCDHVLSKQIVRSCEPGGTLAMEDLTNIRSRAKQRKAQRRRFHGWSFAQLQAFIEYKAEARSVRVVYVDPRYTSQKCSHCQHIERGNRPSQVEFSCKQCRFTAHADTNAAINIRATWQKCQHLSKRAAVNQPIAVTRFAEPTASSAL